MSEGDFEVMPRGTMNEIKMLRQFADDMIMLNNIFDMPVPWEMREKIEELKRKYVDHVEKYTV